MNLINDTTLEDKVLELNKYVILPGSPIKEPIDPDSEIQSLYADIERTKSLLEVAVQDKEKYGPVILKYQNRIDEKNDRIKELKDSFLSADGGPQRPKQYFGNPRGSYSISEAVKELVENISEDAYSDNDIAEKVKEVGVLLDRYRKPQQKKNYEGPGHTTFGNYEIELDIAGLPRFVKIIERYDFGGHGKRTKVGPHVSYDLVFRGIKPVPIDDGDPRSLGQGERDSINIGPQEFFGYRIEGTFKNRKIVYLNPQK